MGLEGWDLFAEVLLKESRMAGSQIGINRTTLKYLIHMKDTHALPSTGSICSFGYCCVLVQNPDDLVYPPTSSLLAVCLLPCMRLQARAAV